MYEYKNQISYREKIFIVDVSEQRLMNHTNLLQKAQLHIFTGKNGTDGTLQIIRYY